MHPLIGDLSGLKDAEVEANIAELSRKYFMTSNTDMQSQIGLVLDTYREELDERRRNEWQQMMEKREKGLDKLINIS